MQEDTKMTSSLLPQEAASMTRATIVQEEFVS